MAPALDDAETISLLDSIQVEAFSSDAGRYAAKEAARRLLARLETPFERAWELGFETPVLLSGLQVCQDLGIWAKWLEEETAHPGGPKTLENLLAMATRPVEPNLLRRFVRHIAAVHILEEVGPDTWKSTPFSRAMGDPVSYLDQTVQCGMDHTVPCGMNLAKFLPKYDYKEPLDIAEFDNYRDMSGDDFFTYCQKHTGAGGSFIGLMAALRNHKMDWTQVYDTTRLTEGANLQDDSNKGNPAPLLVDVGGAHGLDSARFLAKHPELPAGAVVLQDLPDVIEKHIRQELDERITRMPYDFFTPQPVRGARAYFFHAVPHDWPDADCVRIFENVKAAMTKGYSKLIIYEIVLPAQGASSMMTTMDLQLMACTSGLERTEEHWRKLLGGMGFQVVSISRHPRALESVIEAELV
ncbi:hypothetical protein PFICI_13518 [Pestalotiopsis fici W106-1]|uniref:O-methyltransferase C-terminal domain-containing protein n=1 Tax=Pestalotiopsis fici (strain W106-1 / CGMCC3.15140) TaxID=1229662 RepID=W3WMP3_PESFW|nr:uncharacterized protein PFICI_13518 [Pestalotiopsis fici W106-1]ETS75034.1 hypothetical protein PFICI_13518 [Pestalotiopsis fici W106-1]